MAAAAAEYKWDIVGASVAHAAAVVVGPAPWGYPYALHTSFYGRRRRRNTSPANGARSKHGHDAPPGRQAGRQTGIGTFPTPAIDRWRYDSGFEGLGNLWMRI